MVVISSDGKTVVPFDRAVFRVVNKYSSGWSVVAKVYGDEYNMAAYNSEYKATNDLNKLIECSGQRMIYGTQLSTGYRMGGKQKDEPDSE